MDSLDKVSRDVLRKIYKQFESVNEINVSSPEYKKTMIDYLIDHGLLAKIDASSLSGWAYIIQPTLPPMIPQGNSVPRWDFKSNQPGTLDSFLNQMNKPK